MITDVMVDLETLSTENNAAIVSIGAVAIVNGALGPEFYRSIRPESSQEFGLHVSMQTLKWWLEQSEDARFVLTDPDAISLDAALMEFTAYLNQFEKVRIWGNGATFDNVILREAYKATGQTPPWKFYNDLCYRTMKSMIQIPQSTRVGVHHNALDDAIHQAKHLIAIMQALP